MTMISRYRKQSINHLTINRRQHDESWCKSWFNPVSNGLLMISYLRWVS